MTQKRIKVGILGLSGRVGRLLTQELQSGYDGDLELCGGTTRNPKDYSQSDKNADLFITDNPEDLISKSDVVIDFTTPDATAKHMWIAAKNKTPIVIGTTGLSEAQEKEISDAANKIPVVYAPNMSVGVNVLLSLVQKAAQILGPEYDIEISETHHKHKVDAPSGTALALGKAAADGRGTTLEQNGVYDRCNTTGQKNTEQRNAGDIGFAVMRGGDVVGEHTVYFYGEGERIELSHIATDRALFARGALKAAKWLTKQKDTGLYAMTDVLDL